MPWRCHVCGNENLDSYSVCANCSFAKSDGLFYIARITPDDVPPAVAKRVLDRLNKMTDAEKESQLPLVFRTAGSKVLAKNLMEKASDGIGFEDVKSLAAVPGLSPGKFSELIVGLGVDDVQYEPYLGQGKIQPAEPLFSASRTEIEFQYELLLPGELNGQQGTFKAGRCSSCRTFVPVPLRERKDGEEEKDEPDDWEARIDVTKVIMYGEDANLEVSVSMDFSFRPHDFMRPANKGLNRFTFPAMMQLNNNMTMRVRVKSSGMTFELGTRENQIQVGKTRFWPPYGVRLHSMLPSDYHIIGDPKATPVLRVTEGVTFLDGPSNFLNHRPDITLVEVVNQKSVRSPRVRLEWQPVPDADKYERQADYYFVYRTLDSNKSEASWHKISGPVKGSSWVDHSLPPGFYSAAYRVVAVWVTPLGDEFEGFPGQSLCVHSDHSAHSYSLESFRVNGEGHGHNGVSHDH